MGPVGPGGECVTYGTDFDNCDVSLICDQGRGKCVIDDCRLADANECELHTPSAAKNCFLTPNGKCVNKGKYLKSMMSGVKKDPSYVEADKDSYEYWQSQYKAWKMQKKEDRKYNIWRNYFKDFLASSNSSNAQ
jgi:hypothetical protein